MQQYLVALDAVLFDLVKLAFELSLTFQTLLSPAYIDDFSIDLFPIHFINCLGEHGVKENFKLKKHHVKHWIKSLMVLFVTSPLKTDRHLIQLHTASHCFRFSGSRGLVEHLALNKQNISVHQSGHVCFVVLFSLSGADLLYSGLLPPLRLLLLNLAFTSRVLCLTIMPVGYLAFYSIIYDVVIWWRWDSWRQASGNSGTNLLP